MSGQRLSATESPQSWFPGFFVGGFECSSHKLSNGRRLDLLTGTRHVEFAADDYQRLADAGIRSARDGLAWHRIESVPGHRDFSSLLPLVDAARRTGTRVVWDLMHFGWPDDLDVFTPTFVDRFAALARDFAVLMAYETDEPPWINPVNEISFLSWIAADVAVFHPFERERGFELKCQLVRASIAAIEAVRDVVPGARVVVHDPAFHVVSPSDEPHDIAAAEASRLAQFQALDLLCGRMWPQLGGRPDYLDLVGVNYYPWNQWTFGTAVEPGGPLGEDDPRRRPLSRILEEWHDRYRRPVYVGETGCEGERRAAWLRTVCDEVATARAMGVDVQGVCLYPIVGFPGWDNDRHCENGLWDYADDSGRREAHAPLAAELALQQRRFASGPVSADEPLWPRDPELVSFLDTSEAST